MDPRRVASLLLVLAATPGALAQFGPARRPAGPQPGGELTQRWQVGVIVRATSGPCVGLSGTAPLPTEWPEQQVRIAEEEMSLLVRRFEYRDLGGLKQLVFSIPQLPAGETASALVTVEVTRQANVPPEDASIFVLPRRAPREVLRYLAASPSIETRHDSIRAKARELTDEQASAWDQVQQLFDWTRDNIKLQNGALQGAVETLRAGHGNKEDLACVFIALCRARGVPARTVWVPDYCYPEFYLEDAQGQGHWFPCQVAGPREFGGISDYRPILQKGENFTVPEKKEPLRFVPEHLGGKGGTPQVEFVRKLLPAA